LKIIRDDGPVYATKKPGAAYLTDTIKAGEVIA